MRYCLRSSLPKVFFCLGSGRTENVFPNDLIEKSKLGEPYIRSANEKNISKYGLGLGTFIGKTLLEKNYANISFLNSKENKGAEVKIKWRNKDLNRIYDLND